MLVTMNIMTLEGVLLLWNTLTKAFRAFLAILKYRKTNRSLLMKTIYIVLFWAFCFSRYIITFFLLISGTGNVCFTFHLLLLSFFLPVSWKVKRNTFCILKKSCRNQCKHLAAGEGTVRPLKHMSYIFLTPPA